MSESEDPAAAGSAAKRRAPLWQRLLPWVITLACFAYLYNRIGAQTPPGQSVPGYLAEVFDDGQLAGLAGTDDSLFFHLSAH